MRIKMPHNNHIWFFKNVPSKLGLILDIPTSKLEKVIYYAAYIVMGVNEENKKRAVDEIKKEFESRKKEEGNNKSSEKALEDATENTIESLKNLRIGSVLSEAEYFNLAKKFADVFNAGTGGEAIRKILEKIDLKAESKRIGKELENSKDATRRIKLLKQNKIVVSLFNNNLRPEWMVLKTLPVLPPDLRPMEDAMRQAT